MAYLNRDERERLASDLRSIPFNRAKGRLRGMDDKVRLAYFRNAQMSGELHTRYVLPQRGVRVTLVEALTYKPVGLFGRNKAVYDLAQVTVEPTPDNRT